MGKKAKYGWKVVLKGQRKGRVYKGTDEPECGEPIPRFDTRAEADEFSKRLMAE